MIDYSFIRLKKTLSEAKNIGNPRVSNINSCYQIHLTPNEFYCQITNTDFGITLAGDFTVKLVDQCDNEIDDITELFAITQISDIRGLNQIVFEFTLIKDYGFTPLHLKIIHTQSESVYYSNPFICTETLSEQTSLFSYRSYGYFNGISYDMFEGFQQIRLNIWFDSVESQTDVSEYYQITTKNTIASRALYKQTEIYQSTYMNRFVFERSNMMLISDVVFVDGIRITNKPQLVSEDRLGNTNMFPCTVDMFKDYNDEFTYSIQMFEFNLIGFNPTGIFTQSSPGIGAMQFNSSVIDNGNTVIEMRYYDSDQLILSRESSDLTIVNNTITFNIGGLYQNGTYYFTVTPNTLSNQIGIYFGGISDKETWKWRRKNGDYSEEDYNQDDYSINI